MALPILQEIYVRKEQGAPKDMGFLPVPNTAMGILCVSSLCCLPHAFAIRL